VRLALVLALALAAGWALPGLLSLAAGDPLAGTVALLPALAAALVALERWGVARGGRATPRWWLGVEGVALLGWLLAAALRARLGFPHADPLLAAALFALLGQRVARLLLALRPALGATLPARPPAPFFWLPLVAYLAILPWSTGQRAPDGDEPYYLLLAHSLAYDFDAELANNYQREDSRRFMDRALEPQPGDPVGPAGEIYSRHNLLLPLLLAPAYRLGGRTGAAVVMALLTAALAWWSLRLARHVTPRLPGEALLAYALLAFSPPLLLYSHQVWVEVPAALLTVIAAEAALAGAAAWAWGPGRGAALAVPILLLPVLKLRLIALALPLLALALGRQGEGRRRLLAGLTAGLAGLVGAIALFNLARYGRVLKTYSLADAWPLERTPTDLLLALVGLFFDSAFGLFAAAPIWLLLIPALLLLARQRPGLAAGLLLVAAPSLLLVASRSEWYGGWSPPFRYPLALLPLLALALPALLAGRRGGGARLLVAALGALTIVLTLAWLAVPGWTYNLADGSNHLLDRLAGRLELDIARLLPSAVRSGTAIWLWPPVVALLVTLLWWWPRRPLPGARSLGVAAVIAGWALLPYLARTLPTRTIHFEDAHVTRSGGSLHPPRWTIERVRHRGAWVLAEGDWVRAPVIPGGGELSVTLHLRVIENIATSPTLHLRAGDRPLARWQPDGASGWQQVRLGPLPWEAGEPLVLALEAHHPARWRNALVLDRAELTWR
jgi:hypothetical protein